MGIGEIELLFRAGDGHVAQAALFFQGRLLHEGTDAGENAFVHARQENQREFQAFGAVDGHQGDPVLFAFVGVHVVHKGHLFQEFGQAPFRLLVGEIFCHREQFAQVFLAALGLGIVAFLQKLHIFRVIHDFLNELEHIHFCGRIEEVKNHGAEFLQLLLGRCGKAAPFDAHDAFEHGHIIGIGVVRELLYRGSADAALGHIDDAGEADVIAEIVDYLQIGHDVTDFGAIIETGTAYHGVSDAAAHQGFFDDTGLGIHTVEHRHLAIRPVVLIMLLFHGADDEIRLVVLVHGSVVAQMISCIVLRPKALRRTVGVVLNHRIGSVQDGLGGAIILLQLDHLRLGIVLLEIHDIAKVRAAPGVNALVRIADSTDILQRTGNVAGHEVLGVIRILVFVDEDIVETILPALADGLHREQLGGDEKQIIEIKGVVLLHVLVIELVDVRDFLREEITSHLGAELLRIDELVLRIGNMILHRVRLEMLIVQVQFFQTILHQRLRVIRVVNGEFIRIRRIVRDFPSQETGTEGVECVHPDAVRSGAYQIVHTLPHFLGRLIRKGDGQDFSRVNPLLEHVSDAAGQSLRLAGPGAGHDQNRPLGLHHRFPLAVV